MHELQKQLDFDIDTPSDTSINIMYGNEPSTLYVDEAEYMRTNHKRTAKEKAARKAQRKARKLQRA